LKSLDLLTTERTTTEEREQDIKDFGRWAQAWTASLAKSVSTGALDKRKADGKFTFGSLPKPDPVYFGRALSSDFYSQGRYLSMDQLSKDIRRLKGDGWCLDVVLVDFLARRRNAEELEVPEQWRSETDQERSSCKEIGT
jgi:hypothetical protein